MRDMTPDETVAFLCEGTKTGKLAWVGKDGSPHVAPIWFVLDSNTSENAAASFDIIFNTHEATGKAKAMKREGRASMVVDDQEPPYSFVKIDGAITFDDNLDNVRTTATKIGGRYMGTDRAEEFGARNGVAGELVVRLTPRNVQAKADVSD